MSYHISNIRISLICAANDGIEHKTHTKKRWRRAVNRNETAKGYAEWMAEKIQGEFSEPPGYPLPPAPPAPQIPGASV